MLGFATFAKKRHSMNLKLLTSTVFHLKPEQLLFQVLKKIHTPHLKKKSSPHITSIITHTSFIPKPILLKNGSFCFLNLESDFTNWNDLKYGALWAYNLNYMDWLMQPDINQQECLLWIDRFNKDISFNRIGLEPYPTALRCINWTKFFILHHDTATTERLDSLYSQLILLSHSIERHLLGNHVLEDAFAITMGACLFHDPYMAVRSEKILIKELNRQILPDGAHFEQSPMYHCIMLERILDCINLIKYNKTTFSPNFIKVLEAFATKMIGHLKSIIWPDGTIPLLGDSAYGIASKPYDILDYAQRLDLDCQPISMKECGYRHMFSTRIQVIADIGNITASYQPGHSHADTFNYEIRIDGKPFIIDTGISTYNKNERREYERSTAAHNTVTYQDKNSSEVWGGFRVAKRAKVTIIEDSETLITASHDGFGRKSIHYRSFRLGKDCFTIQDRCDTPKGAISRIHFDPDVKILSAEMSRIVTDKAIINIEGTIDLKIKDVETSVEYNKVKKSKVAEIKFCNRLSYSLYINP